uniref:Uncharacterized protein n=1 Tax=Salarias fasciatus TaxID=181472 RepID=A0A672IIT5_SALFA
SRKLSPSHKNVRRTPLDQSRLEPQGSEGDAVTDEADSRPVQRGRGRSQDSKQLEVCVSEMDVSSGDPSGSPSPRGRGRPKLSTTKHTEEDGLEDGNNDDPVPKARGQGRPKGSKKQNSEKSQTEQTPKKRGRPRKSLSHIPGEGEKPPDLPNGGTDRPKRGRPKAHLQAQIRKFSKWGRGRNKRGRPQGSLNRARSRTPPGDGLPNHSDPPSDSEAEEVEEGAELATASAELPVHTEDPSQDTVAI